MHGSITIPNKCSPPAPNQDPQLLAFPGEVQQLCVQITQLWPKRCALLDMKAGAARSSGLS
ncbi:hypothetical protein DSO57_1029714 [Entomophthora muscae]|uniref:Uncharacterized protein n=1 Tax=Entomophthora muscae TaxID=34485 RepID=A0ACC2TN62_9FUNG|nr:hypothetical protein DSO57_1029714 [Entomophthora muscae]